MAHRVRESPEQILAELRERTEAAGYGRLRVTRLGHWARLRIATGPRDALPAFEVGVLDLRFRVEGEITQVEVRERKAWRWWTVGVRAPVALVAVSVDLMAGQTNRQWLTKMAATAEGRSHQQQEDDLERLRRIVGEFLRDREFDDMDDPFRRGAR